MAVPGLVSAADLTVRPWRTDDAARLHEAVTASTEHLRPWMAWIADEPLTVAQRADLIATWLRPDTPEDLYGILAGDVVVGGCGLHPPADHGGLAIGYWVRAGWTGRGYATEAARRLTAIALTQPEVTHVEIHHDVANVASGRVPARLGFALAEERRRTPTAPGETGLERVWRWPPAAAGPPPGRPRANS